MKKSLLAVVLALSPVIAFAQTDPSLIIKQLQEQIKVLQAQVEELKTQIVQVKSELNLTRSLSRGLSGEDVKELQTFLLQKYPEFYSAPITGYFGPLTEQAVRRLQEKEGIEAVGIVGPRTTARLNELVTQGAGKSEVVPPGLLTAPGIQGSIAAPAVTTSTTPSTTTAVTAPATSIAPSTSVGAVVPVTTTQQTTTSVQSTTSGSSTTAATSTASAPTSTSTNTEPVDTTPPSAPSNLSVIQHPNTAGLIGSIDFIWTGSVDSQSPSGSYSIYLDNKEFWFLGSKTLDGRQESFTTAEGGATNLPYGSTHTFYITASDGARTFLGPTSGYVYVRNVSLPSNSVTVTITALSSGETATTSRRTTFQQVANILKSLQSLLNQIEEFLNQ